MITISRRPKVGAEALLSVREESGAVHRSIYYEWGYDSVVAQAGWARLRRH